MALKRVQLKRGKGHEGKRAKGQEDKRATE
jgi:hypothetical protein